MWNPTCKILIGGVEYTSDTIADVGITYGKKDHTEDFRASYASASLLSDVNGLPITINDKVQIKLQNSSAVDVVIFTGRVFDISIEMLSPTLLQYDLNFLSPIAHLGRRIVGHNGYSEEYEGDRIEAILFEAGQITWDQAAGTWADQTGTWNQYESVSGTIETPGQFNLKAYNGEAGFVTDFLTICETSGAGWLYETPDGLMNYNTQARGSLTWNTLSPDQVILSGTRAEITTGFTSTAVEVSTYDGDIYLGTINSGVAAFSKIYEKVSTWIKSAIDLKYWMKLYLMRYGNDLPVLSSFTIPLSALSNAQRDSLIAITVGYQVSITGLPAAIWTTGEYKGYVEGYSWRIQTGQVFLTLNISPQQYSYWKANTSGPSGVPPDSDFTFELIV